MWLVFVSVCRNKEMALNRLFMKGSCCHAVIDELIQRRSTWSVSKTINRADTSGQCFLWNRSIKPK